MNRLDIPVDSLTVSRRVMRRSQESGLWFTSNLAELPGIDEEEAEHIQVSGKFAIDIVNKQEYVRLKQASNVAARYSVLSIVEDAEREKPDADKEFWENVALGETTFVTDPDTGLTVVGIKVADGRVSELDASKDFYAGRFEEIADLDPEFEESDFGWDDLNPMIRLASFDTAHVSNETRDRIIEFTDKLKPATLDIYDVKLRPTVVDVPADQF